MRVKIHSSTRLTTISSWSQSICCGKRSANNIITRQHLQPGAKPTPKAANSVHKTVATLLERRVRALMPEPGTLCLQVWSLSVLGSAKSTARRQYAQKATRAMSNRNLSKLASHNHEALKKYDRNSVTYRSKRRTAMARDSYCFWPHRRKCIV